MFKRRSQILTAAFLVCDLFMTALAWCSSYYVRFYGGIIPVTKATPDAALCWVNLPLVLLLAVGCFQITGQYAIHRLRRLREEVVGVLKGVTLLTLLMVASIFFRHDPYESRPVMALFWASACFLVLTARRFVWAGVRTFAATATTRPSPSSSASAASPARRPAPSTAPAGWASRTSASSTTGPARSAATSTCSAASPTCRN